MKTQLEIRLLDSLLFSTAESRFRIMKEIWSLPRIGGTSCQNIHKKLIIDELTQIRDIIFKIITSEEISSQYPMIREISGHEDMAQVKKNVLISSILGMNDKCIAALNCVNIRYVRMCQQTLKEDYPELFR